MLLEIYGHVKTNSLSLLADALHLLVDLSGFILSMITIRLSQKLPTSKYTFGFHRYEILGALGTVLLIWIAALYLLLEAFYRYQSPKQIESGGFTAVALVGLFVNILCYGILHCDINKILNKLTGYGSVENDDGKDNCVEKEHNTLYTKTFDNFSFSSEFLADYVATDPKHRRHLNMKATDSHVIGDIIQSTGVLIAAGIVWYEPIYVLADVCCTVIFVILVIWSTVPVVREGLFILSEGSPSAVDLDKIRRVLLVHPKVVQVLGLHCWSVGVNCRALNVKILVDHILIEEYDAMLRGINHYLKNEENIEIVTVEIHTQNSGIN
ncbi:MTPA2 [Enterospora canceri]|uniref:MTPA2 n=1 Tax=Enterospora canceri TaxID=1081671 RepID=A0A1Y1S4Q6_9MICR|nr:MTPA2 [Enterospora canceri]